MKVFFKFKNYPYPIVSFNKNKNISCFILNYFNRGLKCLMPTFFQMPKKTIYCCCLINNSSFSIHIKFTLNKKHKTIVLKVKAIWLNSLEPSFSQCHDSMMVPVFTFVPRIQRYHLNLFLFSGSLFPEENESWIWANENQNIQELKYL